MASGWGRRSAPTRRRQGDGARSASLRRAAGAHRVRPPAVEYRGTIEEAYGEADALALRSTVAIAEPLGTETILYVPFGGLDVQGKMLNPRVVHPGEELDFTLDLTRLHVFDKASGKSVRA